MVIAKLWDPILGGRLNRNSDIVPQLLYGENVEMTTNDLIFISNTVLLTILRLESYKPNK